MTNQQYTELLQDLEVIAQELDGQSPGCDFSEDVPEYEIDENYSQLWEGR